MSCKIRCIDKLFLILCLLALATLASCGTDFLYEELEPPREIKIPAPTGLVASDTLMAAVHLSWAASFDAVTYEVYRSNLPEGGAFSMVASNLTATSWTDTNTAANYPFYYKVSYLTAATNRSDLSQTVRGIALPWQAPAPIGITAVQGSSEDKALLSFSAGSNTTAVSWVVYVADEEKSPYSQLVITNATSLETLPLERCRTHYFRVVGIDAGGIASQVSAAASYSVPPAIALPRPTGLTASAGTDSSGIILDWTPSAGANGYRIYRASTTNSGYTLIAGVTAPPWKDTSTLAPQPFVYRVSATNASEESLAHPAVEGFRKYGPWTGASLVMASDGSSAEGIILSWLPVPGAASYAVFRGTGSSGPWTQVVDATTDTTWTDQGIAPGVRAWYQIKANREDGALGPASPSDEGFKAFADAPPMPTGVTGVHNIVWKHKVTWDAVPGISKYRVYIADHYHGPYSQTADVNETEYSKFHMTNYWDYYYRVCSVNSSGHESAWSDPVQSAPNTGVCSPDGLTASQGAARGRINLTWSPARGATKVWLERAPSPEGPWGRIGGDLDKESTGYIDLIKDGPRFYRVQAVNLLYTGGWSQTVMGYPIAYTPLDSPPYLTAVNAGGGSEVVLTWGEINQAAGYRVFRSREQNGLYVDVSGLVTTSSWNNTGIIPGNIWYYKIATVNEAGEIGPLSAPYNNSMRLAKPNSVMASDGSLVNQVAILWSRVPGADHYRVYRASGRNDVPLCISPAIPGSFTQYFDPTPLPGTGWYSVIAFDNAGVPGEVSPSSPGRPKAVPAPNPPVGLIASDGSNTNGIAVTWQPVADAAWYRVARSTRADGDFVFVSPDLTNCEFTDSSAPAKEFFYRVAAFNSDGISGLMSNADKGYKGLSDVDFLLAFDTTVASSHTKMTLMHKGGTSALGKEIKNGDISGQVLYNAALAGLGAKIVFTYANYRDDYLVLDGSINIHANMSENGNMDGTVSISSPAYSGTVRYALIVTGGNASGGYWYVKQQGSAVETQIAWFPSPSSKP